MKKVLIVFILCSQGIIVIGQENYVSGTITLLSGETVSGQINDLFWRETPSTIKFKSSAATIEEYSPSKLLGFSIGDKALYRSQLVEYDSTKNGKSDLTQVRTPAYKKAHLFLKVVVEANKSLLVYEVYEQSHYFIQDGNTTVELVNHHYLANLGSGKLEMENKLYIPKLKEAFADCNKVLVSDKLSYTEKEIGQLFLQYASCNEPAGKLYDHKEKIIYKTGIVGAVGFDHLINGDKDSGKEFKGGVGFGFGGFINILYPNKVYRNSFYSELVYRKFGEQTRTLSGVKETHKINSLKFSFIGRRRLFKLPMNSYIGIGFTTSLGLNDSVDENGINTEVKSSIFWAGILNAGFSLSKNVALDIRYERGNGINYNAGYNSSGTYQAIATGNSGIQASIIVGLN